MLHRLVIPVVQVALLLVLLATSALAAWVPVTGGGEGTLPRVTVQQRSAEVTEVSLTLPGVELRTTTVAGVPMVEVAMPGAAVTLEAGAPELPLLARALRLPDAGHVEMTVLQEEWRVISHLPPVPSRGDLDRGVDPGLIARVRGPQYDAAGGWPAATAELGRPFLVRDRRGVSLRIYPVRWDGERGQLLALASLTVRVTTTGDAGVNPVERPLAPARRAFGPVLDTVFGNQRMVTDKADDEPDEGVGYGLSERMLIVTDPALAGPVANLASWKRECGHLVEVVTMDQLGGSVLGVMDAVSTRYHSSQGLAYLLLVGDVAQVPTRTGSYHGADSDGMYGLLSGDDLFVDILVSRLPARNASEARVMIDRIIGYERDIQAGAAWCGRAAGIASDEGTPPDYERAELLRDRLLGAGQSQVDRIYQGLGGDRAAIAASLEGGIGLVNYLGHGSSNAWLSVPFDNADVHALTNTTAWPWIIDVSCSNGDFSLDECFAEAWLRANHDGQPAGAVAMISASTAASWIPPTVMQATMIDALTGTGETELGAIYTAGVAEVLVQYAGLGQDRKLMEQYNLFGDASMRVRMLPPAPLTVTHDDGLSAGTIAWPVSASAGARVVLTAGQERLARADVDAAGEVLLVPSRPLVEGEQVTLTVAADHAVTYRTTLPVGLAQTTVEAPSPMATALLGNHPNPFNPATTIAFELATEGPSRLSILDVRGRLVTTLVRDRLPAGRHEARWDGRDAAGRPVSAGVYLARLDHGGRSTARSLTLVK